VPALGRDQPANAEAVVAVGAGRVLPPDAPPEWLRATVVDALGDDAAHRSAARLAAVISAEGGPTRAAEVVEQVLV